MGEAGYRDARGCRYCHPAGRDVLGMEKRKDLPVGAGIRYVEVALPANLRVAKERLVRTPA